jgi:hypothetical protein
VVAALHNLDPIPNTQYAKMRGFPEPAFSSRMPLSQPAARHLRHRRAISVEAFEREDGLWDIEARLTDHKPRDVMLASTVRLEGQPIHELWLRVTVDPRLNVVDAEAASDWVPYPSHCGAINPAYHALVGLNLFNNFRRDALARLGGTSGCTHLTELCAVLPTVAIQAFSGDVWNRAAPVAAASAPSGDSPGRPPAADKPPFQLDRCHALSFTSDVVKEFYPRWYGTAPRSDRAERAQVKACASGHKRVAAEGPQGGNEVQSNSQTEGNHA